MDIVARGLVRGLVKSLVRTLIKNRMMDCKKA